MIINVLTTINLDMKDHKVDLAIKVSVAETSVDLKTYSVHSLAEVHDKEIQMSHVKVMTYNTI